MSKGQVDKKFFLLLCLSHQLSKGTDKKSLENKQRYIRKIYTTLWRRHNLSGYMNNLTINVDIFRIFSFSVYFANFSIAQSGKIESKTWYMTQWYKNITQQKSNASPTNICNTIFGLLKQHNSTVRNASGTKFSQLYQNNVAPQVNLYSVFILMYNTCMYILKVWHVIPLG